MKSRIILITLFANLIIGMSCPAQTNQKTESESSTYDISELKGKLSRSPIINICESSFYSLTRTLNWDLKFCLELNLSRELSAVYLKSTYPDKNPYLAGFIHYNFCEFQCEIDNNGKVLSVKELKNYIRSLPSETVKSALRSIDWKPAIKELKPVNSKFIIRIIFSDDICKHELKWDLNRRLNEALETQRSIELSKIYDKYDLYDGVEEDEKLFKTLMTESDSIGLKKSIEKVQAFGNILKDQINAEYDLKVMQNDTISCRSIYLMYERMNFARSFWDHLYE